MAAQSGVSFFRSIKFKIVFITIFLITCILGGFAFFNTSKKQQQMAQELKSLAEVTAIRLSNHLIIPLWDLDKKQVEDTLQAEMLEKRVAAIMVRDSDGKTVFAGKARDSAWKVQDNTRYTIFSDQGMIIEKKAISNGKEKIGDVEVHITNKFSQEELQEFVTSVVLHVLVLDIVMFMAILIVLQRMVITPVRKLAEAAESMSRGNLDLAIDVKSKDEIGYVAEAMERMKISLRLAIQRLQQHTPVNE